ncbi:MAG: hypothetical protein E5Y65_25970 [Mesorhizobium sp.]|uniref:hypothetical protein n=1 Tax=Mesorhizobium sp. TaxID=1871066 RepID=UPI001207A4A8|nr:hypothetical protein [Mesorhizobium sp.]TIL72292.1 MAG: hypothetical protein E5Y70_22530 [Mesorhizobium sp.]TIL86598.1 MAG: hypothetical protein E5Y65_25970 [Mesorhizobium sp.]TIL98401.1 MAG: hypothetical protein E5Y64_26550 [Mesorhizobium sp.]TIM34039.1 MAG: hypothetical protein E5Y61_13955 [Mesorhizobium sp.]TIM80870.1 MAG: hypothetical protein E5Y60_01700 [Mesorhizobium sp.]
MTRQSFAEELESAADRIADMPRADLQIILRRAALMLRNVSGVPLEPATADTLVLREWLETNAYLPVRTIDEESEIDGSA